MPRFLLLIRGGQPNLSPGSPEFDEENARWYQHTQSLRSDGVLLADDALLPPAGATVRLGPDGETLVSEGSISPSAESLTGFYLIDVEGRDEAIDRAAGMPNLPLGGSVEIHQVMTFRD